MNKAIKIKWIALAIITSTAFIVGLLNVKTQMLLRKEKSTQMRILNCSELVSYKCRYTDVVYRDRALSFMPSTRGYSIVRFTALVTLGIANTLDIRTNISSDGKEIDITLPPCGILSNDIEKEEAITEEGTFLRVSTEDMLESIDNAREEMEQSLVSSGFLEDADEHAREAVAQMMEAMGFERVNVKTVAMPISDAHIERRESTL